MRKAMFIVFVILASMNLFAGGMCELYVQYMEMKKGENLPVKIGQCNRMLYGECEFANNKEECIEKIHYSENVGELFSFLSKK